MQIKYLQDEIRDLRSAVVYSLSTLLDMKDLSTGVHSTRLAAWARLAAARLGTSSEDLRDIEIACMLHDIGKTSVPEAILQKSGKLTDAEYEEVKKHSTSGWSILRVLPGFESVAELVLYHHERMDGKGYPTGLTADEIPEGARLVAVVDAFDAMISSRVYGAGVSVTEAIRRLRADSGTHFDPRMVEAFIEVIEESWDEIERACQQQPAFAGFQGPMPITRVA